MTDNVQSQEVEETEVISKLMMMDDELHTVLWEVPKEVIQEYGEIPVHRNPSQYTNKWIAVNAEASKEID